MSQHDLDIANAAGASVRSDINSALQALGTLQSGSSAPSTTYARMLWADTTTNQLKRRNAANSGWLVLCSLDEAFVLSRSSNTILGESDRGKTLIATSGFTQTLTAAATLGDGWYIDVVVDSGVTLVIDPNSTETIDGSATKSIVGPAQGRLVCNGSLFRSIGFAGSAASDTAAGVIEIAVQSEMETGSDTARAVTPGRQQFHPSAVKGWAKWQVDGTIDASYNVTSITDTGTGDFTVNWATDFSSANYAAGFASQDDGPYLIAQILATGFAAGATRVQVRNSSGTNTDPNRCMAWAMGDQ